MQIDDFGEAQALTKALENTLPFQVRPGKEFLKMMRDRGEPVSEKTDITVSSVMYTGDMGGINCTLESYSDGTLKEVFVVSITHLVIDSQHPLAKEVNAYQQKRIRGLKLQDQVGFAAEFLGKRPVSKKKKRRPGFGEL
jgi:hypothetical protein